MKKIYTKPYQTPAQLVQHLIDNGLVISDKNKAERFLSNISYHRYVIYTRPYIDLETNKYIPNTTFEMGEALYRFDDELRDLLFAFIGRIEIKIRTKLDHTVASFTNDPFWTLDDSLFFRSIDNILKLVQKSFRLSEDPYFKHFKEKYENSKSEEFKELPPFWSLSELCTFGKVVKIIESLNKNRFTYEPRNNHLNDYAKSFGAKDFFQFVNWLKLIRDVRNRCAHHSRVWNANFIEPKGIRNLITAQPLHKNRIYLFFVMLHKISEKIGLDIDIKESFIGLLKDYPEVEEFLPSMGFSEEWVGDSFWD